MGLRGAGGAEGGGASRSSDRPSAAPPSHRFRLSRSQIEALDPTGCGDVFGAAAFARLLAGDSVEPALRHAAALAARNAAFRGASGLSRTPAGRAGDAVTRVIEVPAHFDDRSFDSFAEGFGEWPPETKLLFDARGTQWASPYG